MVTTAKKKRVINITLIALLITVIVIGMGVGIYFIITSQSKGLTRSQIRFGQYVNNQTVSPQSESLDIDELPSDMQPGEVQLYTDNYIVSFNQLSQGYKIYSRLNHAYVNITSPFVKILKIQGHVALLEGDDGNLLFNLKDGSLLCLLRNATVNFSDNHVMVKSNGDGVLALTNNLSQALVLAVYDCESLERVVEVSVESDLIDGTLCGKYLSLTYSQKLDIFSLKDGKVIKTFANVSEQSANKNVVSVVTKVEYFLTEYYRAFNIDNTKFLIERCTLTNNDYTIENAGNKYLLSYFVYDTKTGVELTVESEGVLRPVATNLEDYFALVDTKIDQKATINEDKQTITYYSIDTVKKQTTLVKVVSYDYVQQGVIVGFDGKQLVTSGGQSSSKVSFSGDVNSTYIKTSLGEKVTSGSEDGAVLTTVMGQKTVLNMKGEAVTDKWFTRISPFAEKAAVGFDGSDYYLIKTSGEVQKIDNFATEYADYVFMGLGLYFTKDNGQYNVYNFRGEKLAENAKVDLCLDSDQRTVLVKIDGQDKRILKIVAQTKMAQSTLTNVPELGEERRVQSTSRVDATTGITKDADLAEPTIEVDEFGVGTSTFKLDVNLDSLSFRDYDSLNDAEKAMIPQLDVLTGNVHYIDRHYTDYVYPEQSVTNTHYYFFGLYTYSYKNISIAFVKLRNGFYTQFRYFYLAIVLIKDAYLCKVDGHTSQTYDSEHPASSPLISYESGHRETAPIDYSGSVLPAKSLTGRNGFYTYADQLDTTDNVSRTVTKPAAFDGEYILSTYNLANSISLEVTLRNTFVASNVSTDWIEFLPVEDVPFADIKRSANGYELNITEEAGGYKVDLTAPKGYLFTQASLVLGKKGEDSAYEDIVESEVLKGEEGITTSYSFTVSKEYCAIKLKDLCITELYYKIELYDEDGKTSLGNFYHFYGYGYDIDTFNRNPAGLGFENFYHKEQISLPTKTGYTCQGYKMEDGSDLVIQNVDPTDLEGEPVGKYVGNSNSYESTITTYKYVAVYKANEYTIFFVHYIMDDEVKLQPIEDENGHRPATYDQPISNLLDPNKLQSYRIKGYEFKGWFLGENTGSGIELTEQIEEGQKTFNFTQNIIVYLKWEPHITKINLHGNIDKYTDKEVQGFTYNITTITYAQDYNNAAVGASFNDITLEVAYNKSYGELPVLNAEGNSGEKYIFDGWWTAADFTVDTYGDFHIDGEKRDAGHINQDEEDVDLYAHYHREVYAVQINSTTSDERDLPLYDHISYTGSNVSGKYGEYSTAGQPTWNYNPPDVYAYTAYTLQNEELTFKVFTNAGFFVGVITITLYDDDGQSHEITLTGQIENGVLTLSGETNGDRYQITQEDNNLTIALTLSQAISQGLSQKKLSATISLQLNPMPYTHSLTLSQDGEAISGQIEGEGLVDGENGAKINPNAIYGMTYEYRYIPNKGSHNNNVLKTFKVGETTLSFTMAYNTQGSQPYYKLSGNTACVTDQNTDKYTIEKDGQYTIVLSLTYNFDLQDYEYVISITSYTNVAVEITETAINTTASLTLTNASSEAAEGETRLTASAELDNQGATYGDTFDLTPSSVLSYTVRPSQDDVMIFSIIIKIGETDYTIVSPRLMVDVNQISPNFVALANIFNTSNTQASLKNTGLVVEWQSDTKGFKITIANVLENVEVKVASISYRILKINFDVDPDAYYDIEVLDGTKQGKIEDINSSSSESLAPGTGKIYKYSTNLAHYYAIFGNEKSIVTYKIVVTNTASMSYRFDGCSATPSGTAEVDETATVLTSHEGDYYLEASMNRAATSLSIESWIGGKPEEYTREPIVDIGVLGEYTINYSNVNGQSSDFTWSAQNANQGIEFVGNTLTITFSNISGYKFNRVELVYGEDNKQVTPSSSSDGSGYSYTYTFTDFSIKSYVFKAYWDANSFTVEYKYAEQLNGKITGQMESSTQYSFVKFNLAPNQFKLDGYDFLGWSLEPKHGADLTSADAEYTEGQEIFMSYNEGETWTLYAVFGAREYTVSYQLMQEIGSSPVVLVSESEAKLKVDHNIEELDIYSRVGYNFKGWTKSRGGEDAINIGSDVLTAEFLKTLEVEGTEITLYASWEARTYTITVNANDSRNSNGSSTITQDTFDDIVKNSYSLVFDGTTDLRIEGLERPGYNFLGYKAKQLSNNLSNSDIESDTSLYYFNGSRCVTRLSYANYPEIDFSLDTITIYAVYTAKEYTVYVNLNNSSLLTYGKEDGKFEVGIGNFDNAKSSNIEWVDVSFTVLFDKQFPSLPQVRALGYVPSYYCNWFSIRSGSALYEPSSIYKIEAGKIFNYSLYNEATFFDSNKIITKTSELDNKNQRRLSIYACYTINQDIKITADYTYSYMTQTNSYSGLTEDSFNKQSVQTSATCEYGKDFGVLLGALAKEKFISSVTITYDDETGQKKSFSLKFAFINNVIYLDETNKAVTNFISVFDKKLYVADGIYVKSYYRPGMAMSNSLIIGFDFVKTNFQISAGTGEVQYKVDYYTYTSRASQIKTDYVPAGHQLTSQDLSHQFIKYFKFENYYAIESSYSNGDPARLGTVANIGDEVTCDIALVAKYVSPTGDQQAANFYLYNPDTGGYELFFENDYRLTYKSGSVWRDNQLYNKDRYSLDSGMLLELPSTEVIAWPTNTYFAGFIVAEEAPQSGYFSWKGATSDENDASYHAVFDTTYVVDDDINVYAVYDQIYFNLAIEGNNIKINLSLYDRNQFGAIRPLDYNDIYYITLTNEQYNNYVSYKSSYNKEIALRMAIGNSWGAVGWFADQNDFDDGLSPGGTQGYLFVFADGQDSSGYNIITRVADNCIQITGSGSRPTLTLRAT